MGLLLLSSMLVALGSEGNNQLITRYVHKCVLKVYFTTSHYYDYRVLPYHSRLFVISEIVL